VSYPVPGDKSSKSLLSARMIVGNKTKTHLQATDFSSIDPSLSRSSWDAIAEDYLYFACTCIHIAIRIAVVSSSNGYFSRSLSWSFQPGNVNVSEQRQKIAKSSSNVYV